MLTVERLKADAALPPTANSSGSDFPTVEYDASTARGSVGRCSGLEAFDLVEA
jgi:hypothetical protein